MKKLYPSEWVYIEDNAFDLIKTIKRKYDVVTCDTGMGDFFFKEFMLFYNITRKYLCIYSNDKQFKTLNKDNLADKMSDYHEINIKIKEIFKRPNELSISKLGNRYWVIIEKDIGNVYA
jgi:hypothetical protein